HHNGGLFALHRAVNRGTDQRENPASVSRIDGRLTAGRLANQGEVKRLDFHTTPRGCCNGTHELTTSFPHRRTAAIPPRAAPSASPPAPANTGPRDGRGVGARAAAAVAAPTRTDALPPRHGQPREGIAA